MKSFQLKCALLIAATTVGGASAQEGVHPIQAALDAGNIEQAQKLLPEIPEQADVWLSKIAQAQVQGGDTKAAQQSLRRIQSTSELTVAAQNVAHEARGGGTGADFDSLINLITSTVEPDSWDDVGGPGTVQSFPGGVAVDANGVIAKRETKSVRGKATRSKARSLDLTREISKTRFAHGDARRSSQLRMVSLPRLERELMIRLATGEAPTDVMTHLAGLCEIQYLFVFPETNDVVIAGPAAYWSEDQNGRAVTNTGKPVLLLDDFVTLLRNAREQGGQFGCSIDPKKESLAATKAFLARPTGVLKPKQTKRWVNKIRETLGFQDIRVYGIDARSHAARVLVEADYHMKLVGMGLEPSVDGLTSYLDSINKASIPDSMDVLRWWFTLKRNAVTKNEAGNAFEFASQSVRLQSENERLSESGERTNTGQASELNQVFTHKFTEQFGQLRRDYAIYAELDNLFRMALVGGVLQSPDVQSKVDWNADWLIDSIMPAIGPAPTEVGSIVNHRVIDRRHVVVGVSGGVTVNVSNYVRNLDKTQDMADGHSARSAAQKRVAYESGIWWWD